MNDVSEIEGTDFTFYEDTYTGKWYLEIFSDKASKANAVKYLREKYKFDKVTAFGDNLNDLSLFREADVKIAVANAKQELKNSADLVIGSNDDDGVAKWLKNYMKGLF
jgi:hydroxymethylpyrimidine pyrophosphatase-like HAD family hydrolase